MEQKGHNHRKEEENRLGLTGATRYGKVPNRPSWDAHAAPASKKHIVCYTTASSGLQAWVGDAGLPPNPNRVCRIKRGGTYIINILGRYAILAPDSVSMILHM